MLRQIGSGDKVFPRWGLSANTEDLVRMFLGGDFRAKKGPEAILNAVNFIGYR